MGTKGFLQSKPHVRLAVQLSTVLARQALLVRQNILFHDDHGMHGMLISLVHCSKTNCIHLEGVYLIVPVPAFGITADNNHSQVVKKVHHFVCLNLQGS